MTTPNIRELRKQRARRDTHWPLGVRLLLAAAALYLVYVLVGFFVVPSYLKAQIERRASAQLKREVRVGHVAFNPLTLSVTVEKLLVADHDREPLLGWNRLYVNLELLALFSEEVHLSEIELDGFAGRIAVGKDGILNVADISAPPSSHKPGRAWALRIDRLAVNHAEFDYRDESRAEPFRTHLGPTTFILREFRTSGAGAGAPGVFSARTEAGESLQWTGRLALAPLRSNGEVRVEQIALKKYAPFYSGLVQFDVLNGTLDAQVPYVFSIEHNQPQLKLTEASVQVKNVELAERGRTDPVIALKSVEVSQASADLQARTAEINRVVLSGGRIQARRDAQGINLARLAGNAASSSPGVSGDKGAWGAKVNELSAKEFTVSVDDQTTPRPAAVELRNASFSLKRFSLADLGASLPLEFRADVAPGGGEIRGEGTIGLKPLSAELTATVDGTSVAPLSPWVETFANLRLTEGVAAVRSRLRLKSEADGSSVLSAAADVDLTLFKAVDGRGSDLASWKSLAVRGVEYSSNPARLTVADVTLADPSFAVVARDDGSVSVSTLLRQPGRGARTAAPSGGSPTFIAIDRIALANGSIAYLDQSVQPNAQVALEQLSGTVGGLTSAAIDRGDINLNARVAGGAPVTVTGKANVLADPLALDLKVDVRGADLQPLAPYIAKYLGYKLERGAATLDARAKLAGGRLDSAANVVVTDFALGDATNSPDAPHVPIQFALALLRDAQGRITLDLPIQGSLDDPKFNIGGVIVRVLGSLVTKAATSPFSLIGSMFGGGRSGEDLSFQQFAPGSSALDGEAQNKLDVVGKALRERPGLRLTLTGSVDRAADLASLRDAEFERRIRAEVYAQARALDPTIDSPDKVVVSREGADIATARLYHELIVKPQETVIGAPTPAEAAAAEEKAEPKRSRWFFIRWFSRGKRGPEEKPRPVEPPAPKSAPAPQLSLDEMRARVKQALPVGETELNRLAADRAGQVRRYLLQGGQIEPSRIELAALARNGARVSLQLR